MQLLGGREGMGGGEEGGYDTGSDRPARAPASRPAQRPSAPAPQKSATGFDDMDDDIPF
jgi:single-strand DNA-binding protein